MSNDPLSMIIFSLAGDTVLVSWPGKKGSLALGPSDAVTYMMRDFLAQCEMGERMARKRAHG